ncbi:ATP-dependent DNA helicase RecG [Alienimonas californiensis]|uniref:Probable DNA 3'-5' helicase RecG n=1 Tax=Alienimonas californiensis TaxID=2527989 RepID=A0A517P5S3_9PLAN|nr:ATP-dependent DNA helicase RecG [Alienimonas californiensis]QDT14716.1 ATP-dependent DNA helicase RecG [Alienimonas californiensis]
MADDVPLADDPLDTPVQYVRGCGPRRAALLAKLDVLTVRDLLFLLPRDVVDLSVATSVEELDADTIHTVRGVVLDTDARSTRGGRILVKSIVETSSGTVRASFFNQRWMLKKLPPGTRVMLTGKPKRYDGAWEFSSPQVQVLEGEPGEPGAEDVGGIEPRYALTEGVNQRGLNMLATRAVEGFGQYICDPLPKAFRDQYGLPHLRDAAANLHAAQTLEDFNAARDRVLFDDLFEFQLGVALRRRLWRSGGKADPLPVSAKIDARIRRLFPFEFTDGQNQAVKEIAADLASEIAMHRLLQADVGAGKTVVALYAMLTAVAHGRQAVLMAPTEVLANQHWATVQHALAHSRVERRLLTGRLTAKKRKDLRARIKSGAVQMVIGTQALIQKGVEIPRLGVAVVDEQHKFGVAQRAAFSAGDRDPHVLVMTATPIPRSLALTQFGDLDVTTVRDLPPGRQPVVTSRVPGPQARQKTWHFIREKLDEGRQLYVICPKVGDASEANGDSDELSASVEATFKELVEGELKGYAVGLVHGRMDADKKDAAMSAFKTGETRVLVSTTVVEVGVDVPNATLMVIQKAESFGLSQLHQLRGRVARGARRGYCFLYTDQTSQTAAERLGVLERTTDGFQIAEADFAQRGPGHVLGTRQSGKSALRVADPQRDRELLEMARRRAFHLVETGSFDLPEWAMVKAEVLDRFGEVLELAKTG